uniref:PAP_RNA-bind domain-containing protein n=1 Tax=Steinernema glaseri TaxID=37863 RepID=A0A1I8A2D1_9BILA
MEADKMDATPENIGQPNRTRRKRKQYKGVVALLASNRRAAYELEMAQNQIDQDRKNMREEVAGVHRKYNMQFKSLFERRNTLLEIVPNFWRTAIKHHPIIGTILTEADKDFFRYVTRVEVDSREDNVFNFKIRFHLDYNPYLENKVIMKDFHLTACPQFCRVTNLKFRKNILETYKFLDRKRSSRSYIGYKSFFAWLTDNSTPRRDDIAHYFRFDMQMNPMFYYSHKPIKLPGFTKKKCNHKNDFPVPVKKVVKMRKKRGRRGRK